MDNQLSSDQRLILIGRVWGITSSIHRRYAFFESLSKECLITLLNQEDAQDIVDRINTLNSGYDEILECFNEIIPEVGEEDD